MAEEPGAEPQQQQQSQEIGGPEEQAQQSDNKIVLTYGDDDVQPHHEKKQVYIWGGLIVIVLVTTIVALSVTLTKKNQFDMTYIPSVAPTVPPEITDSPTMPPTQFDGDRVIQVMNIMAPVVTDDMTVFQDETTPQYQTMLWLANGDRYVTETGDDLLVNETTSELLSIYIERYVFGLMYFATGGETTWINTYGFLSSSHVCSWEAVICVGGSTNVSGLVLASNGLTGQIPTELGLLTFLDWFGLNLANNTLTGTIPSELAALSTVLLGLDLPDNELTGPIPSELGDLEELIRLDLSMNGLTGAIPMEISGASKLTSLDLDFNSLTSEIPTEVGNMTQLTWLGLEGNNLEGTIPSEIGNLTALTWFNVADNTDISGPLPAEFLFLEEMTDLFLHGTSITGDLDPIVCSRELSFFVAWSNCKAPDVTCSCCTTCCDASGENCGK